MFFGQLEIKHTELLTISTKSPIYIQICVYANDGAWCEGNCE